MESLQVYIPVMVAATIAIVFAGLFVVLARFFGPRKEESEKLSVYECGAPIIGSARQRTSVKFYMVAILFILFDIEVVFLFPWAVRFRELGWFGFGAMTIFLFILVLGLAYEWRKGGLEWD